MAALAIAIGMVAARPVLATPPTRAWAHSSGLIHLPANGPWTIGSDVVDRLKIQEVLARWGIAYDEGRMDVIASLFTEDAVFQVTMASNDPIVVATGRDDIVKSVGYAMKQQGDQRRHAISNIVIDHPEAARASIIAYGVVINEADSPLVGATVVYSGNLARGRDGVWRLTKFVIGMDSYVGTPPAKGATAAPAAR
jgi:ketosteroid isomerase-like protein